MDLAKPFKVTLPAISKHLRVLEDAGLIRRRKVGREHLFTLNPKPMKAASDWMIEYRRFWSGSLDRLANYLDNES